MKLFYKNRFLYISIILGLVEGFLIIPYLSETVFNGCFALVEFFFMCCLNGQLLYDIYHEMKDGGSGIVCALQIILYFGVAALVIFSSIITMFSEFWAICIYIYMGLPPVFILTAIAGRMENKQKKARALHILEGSVLLYVSYFILLILFFIYRIVIWSPLR